MGASDGVRRLPAGQRSRSRQELLPHPRHHRRSARFDRARILVGAVRRAFPGIARCMDRLVRFCGPRHAEFHRYGFLLAGYTVAILGVPTALNPSGAYPLVVARFTEIVLGIACAALVSRVMFPRELARKLVALVRELARCADRFAAAAIRPAAHHEHLAVERAQLVKDFVAVEAMRASAFFESADARLLDKRCRGVTYAALDLCVVAEVATARFGLAAHSASTSLWSFPALISETNNTPRENGTAVATLVAAADQRALYDAQARLHEAEPLSTAALAWQDRKPLLRFGRIRSQQR
jgi:uncharacterized membrane protein YccC